MFSDAYAWLAGGEGRDVVVYTRLRLVRNIRGRLFPGRASASELGEVRDACVSALLSEDSDLSLYAFERLDAASSAALRERRWCGAGDPFDPSRAVLFDPRGAVYAVNDRDHLRISCFSGGMPQDASLEFLKAADRRLDGLLDWACTADLGFLASDPAHVGTGFGLSALLFIPGIVAANMFERVARSLLDGGIEPHFATLGEGGAHEPEPISPFVELRYPCPLGMDEDAAAAAFSSALRRLAEGERRTRERLLPAKGLELEDAAYRAAAVLSAVRLLSEDEGKRLLADLRAGLVFGRAPREKNPQEGGDPYAVLDRLLLSLGSAQLTLWARERGLGEDPDLSERNRALLVRSALPQYHIDGGSECSKD